MSTSTDFTKLILSWEADSSLAIQEILRIS